MTNRREHERIPWSEKIMVRKITGQNTETMVPIYLRDLSEGGMSGTFFGRHVPDRNDIFLVDLGHQKIKDARLVWSFNAIESIHQLGFMFLN